MTPVEISLSRLPNRDWQALRSHWLMFSGLSFCQRFGRKWVVAGFGIEGPSFDTKDAAERYVSNLVCTESRRRAAVTA